MDEAIRVRFYPHQLVDELIGWCATSAADAPTAIAATGLAYLYGLNEHQLGRVRIDGGPQALVIPLARRMRDMQASPRAQLEVSEPSWLAAAAACLRGERRSGFLFRPRSTVGRPLPAGYFRRLVLDASVRATGHRLTVAGLNRSRIAHAADEGLRFVGFDVGYAPSWAARLMSVEGIPDHPRPA